MMNIIQNHFNILVQRFHCDKIIYVLFVYIYIYLFQLSKSLYFYKLEYIKEEG
jgi:hypothetical protein